MKVLSVPQPFAELIVRGVKCWERRTWGTEYRGPLAIHGSSAVPSHSFVAQAQHDEELWGAFWAQGWGDRDALMCLPRSAVIGVVELVRVVPAREMSKAPPLVGEIDDSDFLWEFAHPVWIDPLGPLSGKLQLWTLPDNMERKVEELKRKTEDGWRKDGYEPRPGQGLTLRDKLHDDGWLDEPPYAWPHQPRPPEPKYVRFVSKELDDRVERVIRQYYEGHQSRTRGAVAEVRIDGRLPELAALFEGKEWVSRVQFETVIRDHVYRSSGGEASVWAGAGPQPGSEFAADPYEDFSADDEILGQERYWEFENGMTMEVRTVDDIPVERRQRRDEAR